MPNDQTTSGSQGTDQPADGSQNGTTGASQPATETIKVGEKEFSPDQLNELVEKGELASQIEKEQNLSIKDLQPEFTRRSQKLKEYEDMYADELEGEELPPGEDADNPYPTANQYPVEEEQPQTIEDLRKIMREEAKRETEVAQLKASLQSETQKIIKENPNLTEKEIYEEAMKPKSIKDAYLLMKMRTEIDKEQKEKASLTKAGGASPIQGTRPYNKETDSKKPLNQILDEAEEDYKKLTK